MGLIRVLTTCICTTVVLTTHARARSAESETVEDLQVGKGGSATAFFVDEAIADARASVRLPRTNTDVEDAGPPRLEGSSFATINDKIIVKFAGPVPEDARLVVFFNMQPLKPTQYERVAGRIMLQASRLGRYLIVVDLKDSLLRKAIQVVRKPNDSPQGAEMALFKSSLAKRAHDQLLRRLDSRIQRRDGVGDNHFAQVRHAVHGLPRGLREFFLAAGVRVIAIPSLSDAGFQHGTIDGRAWAEVRGAYVEKYAHSSVFIPEYYIWEGKRAKVTRISRVLLHELGHAFDHLRGRISYSYGFRSAYQADTRKISGPVPPRIDYCRLPGRHGPKEAFAEAFRVRFQHQQQRPSPFGPSPDRHFSYWFPSVCAYVETIFPAPPEASRGTTNNPLMLDIPDALDDDAQIIVFRDSEPIHPSEYHRSDGRLMLNQRTPGRYVVVAEHENSLITRTTTISAK